MNNVKCFDCAFCDKESVLMKGKWILTKTGYCLANNSAVNNNGLFYVKVYANTTKKQYIQYERIKICS